MKRFALVWGVIASLMVSACSRHREITSLQRKEAANLASEAQFAMTLRDLPRTEGLLTKATALCPDEGDYWASLGSVRMRMKNRDGAKAAYRAGVTAYKDAYQKDPKQTEALIQEIYLLTLLGDVKEARAVLQKAQKKNPSDRAIEAFVRDKQIDAMVADPSFKEMAL